MSIITLTTDFGIRDYYVAALKASILSYNPKLVIVDICHEIQQCDLAHATHIIKSVFKEFPKETIHLVSINSDGVKNMKIIAAKIQNHYFLGADNGLFSLIADEKIKNVVEISSDYKGNFSSKNILAEVATKIADGIPLIDLGKPLHQIVERINRKLKVTKNKIIGNVIHVNNFGNLITNIDWYSFNSICTDQHYIIYFGREKSQKINVSMSEVQPGNTFIIFNDNNFLEIGIFMGNASELLGINYDSPISIIIKEINLTKIS